MTQFYDEAAEWRLLGSIAAHPDHYKYSVMVRPVLVTDERRRVLEAMKAAYTKFGVVNPDAIESTLGYVPGEMDVAGAVPIRPLVANLERLARKRQLKEMAQVFALQADVFDPDIELIHAASQLDPVSTTKDGDLTVGVQKVLGTLRQKKSGNYRFCRTGLKFLDSKLGGEYRPASLTILLGNSGHGKTTLAINSMLRMAQHVDKNTGEVDPIPTLLISLEMTKEDLVSRWAADLKSIDYRRILEGDRLNDAEVDAVEDATRIVQGLPMYVVDEAGLDFAEMLSTIRDYAEKGVRAVFIDYLQIVAYDTGNPIKDLGYIAKTLKRLAMELGIAVVLLSQVTETNEGQERVRGSREPVHHADTIIEVVLEEPSAFDPKRSGKLEVYKNRFGPLGRANITFTGIYQRFDNYEEDTSYEE